MSLSKLLTPNNYKLYVGNLSYDSFTAETGTINNLNANSLTAGTLTAETIDLDNLEVSTATITGTLNANAVNSSSIVNSGKITSSSLMVEGTTTLSTATAVNLTTTNLTVTTENITNLLTVNELDATVIDCGSYSITPGSKILITGLQNTTIFALATTTNESYSGILKTSITNETNLSDSGTYTIEFKSKNINGVITNTPIIITSVYDSSLSDISFSLTISGINIILVASGISGINTGYITNLFNNSISF